MHYSLMLGLVRWSNVIPPATRTDANDRNTALYTIKHIIYRLLFFLAISQQLFDDENDDDADASSGWRLGVVVSVVGRINEVNQHRAWLVHDG